jgi:hypothetical protein
MAAVQDCRPHDFLHGTQRKVPFSEADWDRENEHRRKNSVPKLTDQDIEKQKNHMNGIYCSWTFFKCRNCDAEYGILAGHVIHVSTESWNKINRSSPCVGTN